MSTRKPFLGASMVTAVEGLSLLVGFIAQPFLMRALGIEAYGEYVLALSVGTLASTLTDFGFNYAGVQRSTAAREDPDRLARYFWAIQSTKVMVGSALVTLAGLLLLVSSWAESYMLVVAVTVGVLSAVSFPAWHLLSLGRLMTLAWTLLLGRSICLLAIVAFVGSSNDRYWALILSLGAPLVSAAVLRVFYRNLIRVPWSPIGARDLFDTLRVGLSSLWIAGVPAVQGALVPVMVLYVTSGNTLGLYASADKIRAGVLGLFLAFSSSMFSGSLATSITESAAQTRSRAWRVAGQTSLLAGLAALPLVLVPEALLTLISGPMYLGASEALRWMGVVVILSAFNQALVLHFLAQAGRYGTAFAAVVSSLVVYCLVMLAWAGPYEAWGAVVCMLFAESLLCILLLYCVRRLD